MNNNNQQQRNNGAGQNPNANAQAGGNGANPPPANQPPIDNRRYYVRFVTNQEAVVNTVGLESIEDHSLTDFNYVETNDALTANEAWELIRRTLRWYQAGSADFLDKTGVALNIARGGIKTTWTATQNSLFETLNRDQAMLTIDNNAVQTFENMSLQSNNKQPQDAYQAFHSRIPVERREKVKAILFTCYKAGIYAPAGITATNGVMNTANMTKFLSLSSLSWSMKEAVISVFAKLDIGSQNGFGLNHYIKALYDNVRNEDNFNVNTGLLDYYFFDRLVALPEPIREGENAEEYERNFLAIKEENMRRTWYWLKYAVHYYETILAIREGKKNVATAKMPFKKNTDLKFDKYSSDNLSVVREFIHPWEIIDSRNISQIGYFLAVLYNLRSIDSGVEHLGTLMRERTIFILKAASAGLKNELKHLVLCCRKLRTNRNFMSGFSTSANSIRVNISQSVLTPEEIAAALNVYGARLTPVRNRRAQGGQEDPEEEEYNDEDFQDADDEFYE